MQPILGYCAPLLLAVLTALAQNNASWLPVGEPVVSPAPDVDAFLKSLHGNMRLLGCWYAGSKLTASRPFNHGELTTPSTKWKCAVRPQRVADNQDALDLSITFMLSEGAAMGAGVAVAFDFADWSNQRGQP